MATDGYDVDWTTPHCVLVMRMIGLALDYADGDDPANKNANAIRTLPNILEVLGFSFFFGGVTVGPQFSFELYNNLAHGTLGKGSTGKLAAGIKRLLLGLGYIGGLAYAMQFFPDTKLFDKSFQEVCPLECSLRAVAR